MNLIIILTAISLSMDTFSLSLIYGTLNLNKKDKILLSTIVGIYHFIMPLLGLHIGNLIFNLILINTNYIVSIILSVIGIQMILSKNDEEIKEMKKIEYLFFGLAVSIDSFTVGITLTNLTKNIYFSSLIFSLTSFIFTLIGLHIGNKIERLVGKLATIIGGAVLILIGLSFVIKM